jgi:hypothetical protein
MPDSNPGRVTLADADRRRGLFFVGLAAAFVGVAAHHVASVAMPFLGGILWTILGYQSAFLIGVARG